MEKAAARVWVWEEVHANMKKGKKAMWLSGVLSVDAKRKEKGT